MLALPRRSRPRYKLDMQHGSPELLYQAKKLKVLSDHLDEQATALHEQARGLREQATRLIEESEGSNPHDA